MKLQTQAIVGFAAGVVVAIAAVLIIRSINPIPPPPPIIYDSAKVDGNTLKALYNNGNFSALSLNFRTIANTNRMDLQASVYNNSGTPGSVPPGLIRFFTTGTSISGDRILSGYYLEHNHMPSRARQLQTLDSIITRNPGGYFILKAGDYRVIDPSYNTYIYYQIIPHASNGALIDVSRLTPRALQLDPCPPAHAY